MEQEQLINKTMELLSKYEGQNTILKEKGKFNMQQANHTMKRFAEELCSFYLKDMRSIN